MLLLWVCWKMYRELRHGGGEEEAEAAIAAATAEADATPGQPPRKTLRQAVTQILVADVSMSLDNVLGRTPARPRTICGCWW